VLFWSRGAQAIFAYATTEVIDRSQDDLVFLLTALGEQSERNAGLEAGADDFLSKPVDRQELILRVDRLARPAAIGRRSSSTPTGSWRRSATRSRTICGRRCA
jgi:DNA-binding response OmpR family regulator